MLAQAGVASRRAAEELIAEGRVSVDGMVVREQGRRVDPENAVIHVDGSRIVLRDDVGAPRAEQAARACCRRCRTTRAGRVSATSMDATGASERLFHVGRLDTDSEGLLLLTNDGELRHRLIHPSFGVPKTYMAEVPGPVAAGRRQRLRAGVELDDGAGDASTRSRWSTASQRHVAVEVVLHEGRKHIVRRLLDAVGHPVARLVRTAIGDVRLGPPAPGHGAAADPVRGGAAVPDAVGM